MKQDVLMVKPSDGVARELARAPRGEELSFQAWSADSKYVLFRRTRNGGSLHAVAVATGEEIDLRIPLIGATNPISVRPGTNEIAYPEQVIEQELWIRPLLPHIK